MGIETMTVNCFSSESESKLGVSGHLMDSHQDDD